MNESTRDRHNGTEEPRDNQPNGLSPGDLVEDREDDEPDVAVVINLPDVPAGDWVAYEDDGEEVTVADSNPDYAEDAEVVTVVFRDDLLEHRPEYDGREIPLAYAEGFKFYSFPAPRLEKVGEFGEGEPQLPAELEPVEERLQESATVERDRRDGEVVLTVEKLGEEYTVTLDGSVEGDGALRDRLAGAVEEVLA